MCHTTFTLHAYKGGGGVIKSQEGFQTADHSSESHHWIVLRASGNISSLLSGDNQVFFVDAIDKSPSNMTKAQTERESH